MLCQRGPRSVTLRRSFSYTSRWVSLSRFCASQEEADVARGGLGPRIISSAWGQDVIATALVNVWSTRECGFEQVGKRRNPEKHDQDRGNRFIYQRLDS